MMVLLKENVLHWQPLVSNSTSIQPYGSLIKHLCIIIPSQIRFNVHRGLYISKVKTSLNKHEIKILIKNDAIYRIDSFFQFHGCISMNCVAGSTNYRAKLPNAIETMEMASLE